MADGKLEYNFFEEPDDSLKCSICLELVEGQPMQHGGSCGKLFCKDCIKKNGNKPCPMCRGENPQYFEDAKSLREIKSLRVRCINVTCKSKGVTVGTLEDHINKCRYTVVECTNKCMVKGERFHLMRKDLMDHVKNECPNRAFKCMFCGEEGTYTSITKVHLKHHCLKKRIRCPNTGCTLTVERGGVEEHVASECEHTIVACKYSNIGCPEKKKRRIMKTHEEDDGIHLGMSLNAVSQLSNTVAELSNTVVELGSTVGELNSTVAQLKVVAKELANAQNCKKSISIEIRNFREKKEANEMFSSEPFFTIPNGYKMQLVVYCNGYGDAEGTHLSVYTRLLDVPYKDQLNWPFRGTVTVELLNHRGGSSHKEIINCSGYEQCGRPGVNLGCSTFIRLSLLVYTAGHANKQHIFDAMVAAHRSGYLKDNSLYFKVTVQEK